jgi:hypothetical protein
MATLLALFTLAAIAAFAGALVSDQRRAAWNLRLFESRSYGPTRAYMRRRADMYFRAGEACTWVFITYGCAAAVVATIMLAGRV